MRHHSLRAAFLLGAIIPSAAMGALRAGAARRVITPDLKLHSPVYMAGFDHNRKATGIHDDLYVRCAAFSTGARPLVLCGVDLIGLFFDDVRKIRAKVNADVVIAALHDHEGPDTMGLWGPTAAQTGINEAYVALVVDRAVEAANEAIRTMRPARLRLAKIRTPELDTFIHDTRPPVVHDSEIIALQADALDGKPIATLVNWANHPETLGSKNTLVTADYPGYLYKEAEKLLGGTAVFINGAVGGMQSPLGCKIPNVAEATFEKAEFIGNRVAQLAAGAIRKAQPVTIDAIAFRESLVQIPMANQGFQMASKAGIFGGRKAPNPAGATTTPVGYIRFSRGAQPQLEIALIPGELYPELSVGGVERYPGADFPDAAVEPPLKQMLTAPYRMLFGLADDENGYIIPKAEWDEKAPWLQNASKRWYGEVNSLGPDTAALVAQALVPAASTLMSTQSGPPVAFNRDIRPILSDKCFTCHGPDAANRKTKVRFDVDGGARSVAAEIVRRVSSTDTAVRMPPAYAGRDRLKDSEIDVIRRWVEQGAPWQPFWSLIPPQRPAPPAVRDPAWVRNPIDSFILAKLERSGLHPQPEADRATLLRRVSFDLTGLPPRPAEVDSFLADTSPDAYSKVVDRLLASPRYGERMAFRWMEAARYGDTNGYQTDGPRDMWRWRDWVIDAFNRNMPYDRFTVEQLAGDLLPDATLEQRIASGFNRNHRTSGEGGIIPEEYRVEYVADRAQTTSIVWLGLTTGCARCHDHKYDPISQKDFYRLFAYFNQVPDEKGFVWNYGNEEPLVKAPSAEQARKLAELDAKIAAFRLPSVQAAAASEPVPSGWTIQDGLVYRRPEAHKFDGKEVIEADGKPADFDYMQPFTFAAWITPGAPDGAIVTHAEDFFEGMGHGLYLVDGKIRVHIHRRWTDLGIRVESAAPVALNRRQHVLVTYDGDRKAKGVRIYVNGESVPVKILFDQNTEPIHAKAPLRIGGGGGLRFRGEISDVRVYNRALSPLEAAIDVNPDARLTVYSLAKPLAELRALERERKQFYDSIPSVMVMADGAARDTFVLKRGAYDAPGEKVTAGVPGILPALPAGAPNNRLGLARWLVDRGNPLTARVTVNRFWQSYFGYGIVKTVDDFGAQGEFPVHPELLDWLAVEFMESGWDVKKLQKTIVMSAAYRQSSRVTPELLQKDPDNRLLARGPRFRLGPEMIRDQALAVSGLLVERIGGPSVKPYQPAGLWQELGGGGGYRQDKGEGLYRRSLYTYWKRTIAPPFMVNFDSPNREQCTVFENRTNSPLQALDLMNDVTFLEAARKLGERMMAEGGIDYGFKAVLARQPRTEERQVLAKTLDRFRSNYHADPAAAAEFLKQGESPVPEGLDRAELAAYTAIASLLLNLDEVVTKQ